MTNLTKRVEKEIDQKAEAAENIMENSLEMTDNFIYEALYDESKQSASQLYQSLMNETDPEKLLSTRAVFVSLINGIISWSKMVDFIMIYTQRADSPAWLEAGSADSYRSRQNIKEYVAARIEQNQEYKLVRYEIYQGQDKTYMLRVMKIEGSYLIVGVSENVLLKTFESLCNYEDSIAYGSLENGQIRMSTKPLGNNVNVKEVGSYVKIDRKSYLVTGYDSSRTGYRFGVLVSRSSIMKDTWIFQVVFLIVGVSLVVLIPLSFHYLYRNVIVPIREFSDTMAEISGGEMDSMMDERQQLVELSAFAKTFNDMLEQIKDLKIQTYEEKLAKQKASMNYLMLQIKPHFYANALNIIYSLAERKDYETIQKISKAIVNYSRYMFQDANELVELSKEIMHVRDFMEIQEIRYMMQVECRIDVPEEIQSALIPPFLLQTFVENSVKHAFTTKRNCMIYVKAHLDEEKEYLFIEIRDNGIGYSEEILQQNPKDINEEGHIGFSNICRRLQLIYEEKARIKLLNDNGAVTYITIPYIAVDNMIFEDDF